MMDPSPNATELTQLLHRLETGERDAINLVIPLVYDELKKLARSHLRRELHAVALETTVLVHEAFLKMAGGRHPSYENRAHFFGIASRLMRQVLIDAARARATEKRSGAQEVALANLPDWGPPVNPQLLVMDEALGRLEHADPRRAKLIEMRFFGGLTAEECALALSMPVHAVRREIRLGQAWLRKEMTGHSTAAPSTNAQPAG